MDRIVCLLIGYLCGNFLTAEAVARYQTGQSARALGTGNPGMANIAETLGVLPGALVLAGDVLKTALACWLCRGVLFPELGQTAVLYAGLGAVLGHNFPLWTGFRGGKGVAVTCAGLVFYAPLWGVLCCLVGLGVILVTGYLPVGALVIPVAAIPFFFLFCTPEAGTAAALLALIMLSRHIHGLCRVAKGTEEKKFRRKTA